ncbi:hypothetical protein FQN57_007082 [Myotisia sp. PD_48]|nr:hypothetical protein FQN57_007082 [Myotisia sp. PD_48]
MSLKQEIETWVEALAHYDNNEFQESLCVFANIADTAKILFNCGVIYATLGEHYKAVDCYQRAIALDKYFAIAYFQQGVSNFLVGDFEESLANFNDTLLYLRGNSCIDYDQLGLKFKLFSCEVLFNRGLCYIYLRQVEAGMQDLEYASREKTKPDHEVIDEAIKESAEGYTVFSIPVGVVYRPSEAKVKNLKTKEYLGKARLVAASDRANTSTGFQGSELQRAQSIEPARDDRPPETISFGATNLVQKNLSSRHRQQSEPPISRNTFPPTPPPEAEKPPSCTSNGSAGGNSAIPTRSASTRAPRPQMLNLGQAGDRKSGMNGTVINEKINPKIRLGTVRTASEPRGPPSRQFPSMRNRDGPPNGKLLFRETTPYRHARHNSGVLPLSEDDYAEGLYDVYSNNATNSSETAFGSRKTKQLRYVSEQGYESDTHEEDSAEDLQFEMVRNSHSPQSRRRGASRRPEIKKIRVKVHAEADTRFILVEPTMDFATFEGKIRGKFGFKSALKIKMQDDGDMITLADQDDLEMLILTTKQVARMENNDMGKMEVWVTEIK